MAGSLFRTSRHILALSTRGKGLIKEESAHLHLRMVSSVSSFKVPSTTANTYQLFSRALAVRVILVPCSTVERQRANRRFRVVLEWIDSRPQRSCSLASLILRTSLPSQLRCLVRQMSSRLLIEALLKSSSSAQLFHRSWQQRQRQVQPIVDCIAASVRSLLTNASKDVQLAPLLKRLEPEKSLPSQSTIGALLHQIDAAAFRPSSGLSAARDSVELLADDVVLELNPGQLGEVFDTVGAEDDGDDDDMALAELDIKTHKLMTTRGTNDEPYQTALSLFDSSDSPEASDAIWPDFHDSDLECRPNGPIHDLKGFI